ARDVGDRVVPTGRRNHARRAERARQRPRARRRGLLGSRGDREAELPGVEGAHGHPRDHARRPTRVASLAAMAVLDELIAELERSYTETRDRMSDPAVYNDHREAADVGRRLKQLEAPYNLAQKWRQANADLDAARGDAELSEMVSDYESEVARLEEELKLALAERDPA